MDYGDSRLTAIYDSLNPASIGDSFYLDLAGREPKAILDMGCGTGRLAAALASRGHQVTGADPAVAMLDVARERPDGDKVTWIRADAAALSLAARFDLIIMTGHAFQKLFTDEEIAGALSSFARHLNPNGMLAFETRNPLRREWEEWRPEFSRERVTLPNGQHVGVHNDIRSVQGEFVTYETHVSFGPDDRVVGADTLRFIGEDELALRLRRAGFTRQVWYGNWDRSPVGPDSPELIVLSQLEPKCWAPAIQG